VASLAEHRLELGSHSLALGFDFADPRPASALETGGRIEAPLPFDGKVVVRQPVRVQKAADTRQLALAPTRVEAGFDLDSIVGGTRDFTLGGGVDVPNDGLDALQGTVGASVRMSDVTVGRFELVRGGAAAWEDGSRGRIGLDYELRGGARVGFCAEAGAFLDGGPLTAQLILQHAF
jgi:hypothetical protein